MQKRVHIRLADAVAGRHREAAKRRGAEAQRDEAEAQRDALQEEAARADQSRRESGSKTKN